MYTKELFNRVFFSLYMIKIDPPFIIYQSSCW